MNFLRVRSIVDFFSIEFSNSRLSLRSNAGSEQFIQATRPLLTRDLSSQPLQANKQSPARWKSYVYLLFFELARTHHLEVRLL